MKKTVVCGMLLALLTTVGVAQRGRAMGGVGPTARMPGIDPIGPSARVSPSSVNVGHNGVAPNAVSAGTHAKTVTPNATKTAPNTKTVSPKATTVPDRAIAPDAQGISDHARIDPNQ